ncbi:MAG: SAM-dependent methyltransferase, partial [Treponemataceae bacterium]|nr:SAM-dependent methyltransferase [Treponemataceae bacterium]
SNLQVFEKILVKSSIFQLRKNNISETFLYINNGTEKTLQKNILNDKWIFENKEEVNARRFGDYFEVSHVVATLNNSVFVLNDYTEDDTYYYVENYRIEKSCVKPTATPRSLRYGHEEKIIFPYYYENNLLCHYSDKEFSELFPEAYAYLLSKKTSLYLRKADKNALWFEYGRSQALSKINKEKLLISTVITDEVPVYRLSNECIPYAGMYITAKNELSLEDANLILRDNRFLEYTKRVGISITGSSVRITSKDIVEYRF